MFYFAPWSVWASESAVDFVSILDSSVEDVAYQIQSHECLKKYKLLTVCVYTSVYGTIPDMLLRYHDRLLHRETWMIQPDLTT